MSGNVSLTYPLTSALQRVAYNRTWIPPNLNVLNLSSDCAYPSIWLAHYFRTIFPNGGNYPAQATTVLLSNAYRQYWNSSNIRRPNEAQIMAWFYEDLLANQRRNTTNRSIGAFLQTHVLRNCRDEFCSRLPWQGNSDQAGRGMLLTYCAQAVMVTIYVAILLFARASRRSMIELPEYYEQEKETTHPFLHRIRQAVRNTLRIFLDGSLLFCIAMVIAAIVGSSLTLRESRAALKVLGNEETYRNALQSVKAPTKSSPLFSSLAALLSIFPAMALHSIAPKVLRRETYRNYVWVLVACLTAVMMIVTELGITEAEKLDGQSQLLLADVEGQYAFETRCLRSTEFKDLKLALRILFAIRGGLTLLYLIFLALWSKTRLRTNRAFILMRRVWNITAPVSSVLGMWCTLAIFWYFRNKIGSRSGETNKDHEWTFGQIIAISTFAPVVVELAFSWKQGARKANETALNKGFEVVWEKQPEKETIEHPASESSGDKA